MSESETIDLEEMFCRKNGGTFALRIRSDSMIDDHLCDGDIVIIERRDNAMDGEMAVVQLDSGTTTIKRYYREGDIVRLQPGNRSMGPWITEPDKCKVLGVVIGVVRTFKD